METYSLPSRFFVSEKPFVRATQARTLFSIVEIKRTHSQQSRVSTVHIEWPYDVFLLLFGYGRRLPHVGGWKRAGCDRRK